MIPPMCFHAPLISYSLIIIFRCGQTTNLLINQFYPFSLLILCQLPTYFRPTLKYSRFNDGQISEMFSITRSDFDLILKKIKTYRIVIEGVALYKCET